MAKALQFKLKGASYALAPTKVERKKLYGWTELRATTPDGNVCRRAGLDSGGVTIVPTGAVKLGALTDNGEWMEKSELVAVHADGTKAEMVPSSFDAEIDLSQTATMEDLLDCIVSSVYVLTGDGMDEMAKAVGAAIYEFPFCYRAGYEASTAFLLSNGTALFLITGNKAKFDFIGLEEQGTLDEADDEPFDLDSDDLDFSMM